ncbi:MAG: YbaN family protein [Paracoccaceae bacterium]
MRMIWAALGLIALAAGMVGLFLPVIPTVPFLILAAFCFARGSERLHRWLLAHPVFGPPIQDWQESGAVSRRIKWIASLSMAAGFAAAMLLSLPVPVLAAQGAVMLAVAVFIWTRPEA